jgi:hypothetical protein
MLLRREDSLVFALAQKSETQRSQRIPHRAHRDEKTVCSSFSVISLGLLSEVSVVEAFDFGFAALYNLTLLPGRYEKITL